MKNYKDILVDTNLMLLPEFNLSLLHHYSNEYHKDETGKEIKNYPILRPLEWIYLDETQDFLYKIFNSKYELSVALDTAEDMVNNVYTDKFAVYLAYLQYCFGNDLTQIINDNLWV